MIEQPTLFELPPPPVPVSVHQPPGPDYVLPPIMIDQTVSELLDQQAVVAFGVSGGKDGSVAALRGMAYLDAIGHTGPRVLIHADLGRIEWEQSAPICRQLAERLNVELIEVRRPKGDMIDRWLQRWADNVNRYASLSCVQLIMPWSSASWRFCTSELKTAIIARELKKRFPGQPILSVTGIRRQESSARAKKPVSSPNKLLTSQQTIRHVDLVSGKCSRSSVPIPGVDWNPVLGYSEEDVWATHHRYGLPIHDAYRYHGSSRVSCRFCVLAKEEDLRVSAVADSSQPVPVYGELVDLEIESTFGFKEKQWLGDVAPHLLTDRQRYELVEAKRIAIERKAAEAAIPAHLLYGEGWPQCVPTYAEASLLAQIRCEVARLVNLTIDYTTADAVAERYETLYNMAQLKAKAKTSRTPSATPQLITALF